MRPRWILLAGFILVALVIAGVLLSWRSAIAPIAPPPPAAFAPEQIARGRILIPLGDCMTCHTAKSGRPFAGGVAIHTTFGTIYSTNITPDPATGIGTWSRDAFARALRQGIARDGTHLYPAFPYDHFAQLSGADVSALYGYLMTREPVRASAPSDRLFPPFDIRALMSVWNLVFFHREPFRADTTKDAAWNRGAYLVETLGHCGACHTPHNTLGSEKLDRRFEGGTAEDWYAPPLGPLSPAPATWTADELTNYLRRGFDLHHGGAAGPMRRVTDSLKGARAADVRAIATYVASLFPRHPAPRGRVRPNDASAAAIYSGACAACHDQPRWPPLSDSTTLAEDNPRDTVQILVNGIPWQGDGLYMPPFGAMLDDGHIAQLANYLRARFLGRAPWNNAQSQAGHVRGEVEQ